jgi:hypothetical protein
MRVLSSMRHAFFMKYLKFLFVFLSKKSLVRNVNCQIPLLYLKKSNTFKIFIFRMVTVYIILIINTLHIYILNFHYFIQ